MTEAMGPSMDGRDTERTLLERMEDGLVSGFNAEAWSRLVADLAAREDAGLLLRRVHREAAVCRRLTAAFDAAPVPPALASRIKDSLQTAWRKPSAPGAVRRLSLDQLDGIAAAGQPPPVDPEST